MPFQKYVHMIYLYHVCVYENNDSEMEILQCFASQFIQVTDAHDYAINAILFSLICQGLLSPTHDKSL